MSGILGVIAAASGGINSSFAVFLTDISPVIGTRTVSVAFATDGTASAVGAGSAPDWYLPTTTGIGSSWSVRVSLNSSSNTTASGPALGSWQVLSSTKTYSFANSSTSLEGTGSAAVAFSPDGGSTVIAAGDIGDHFPPSDPQWKGASSDRFLAHAAHLVAEAGCRIAHVDVTIICEAPKIGPHKFAMREALARILGIDLSAVSVKATTTERLGLTGRGEGIAAQAVATVVAV